MPAARSHFSALSSNSSGSRPFKPRDTGATPVRAAIFLKEALVLDPRLESASPYRIRMKPAGGLSPARAEFMCARGVTATRRSASPQSRVRFPARAPFLELWCLTVAQRTFNPPGAGASPAGSAIFSRVGRETIRQSAKLSHAGASPARASNLRSPGSGSRRLPRHRPRSAGNGGLTTDVASYDPASHFYGRKRRVRRRSHKPAVFRATRNPAPSFFGA